VGRRAQVTQSHRSRSTYARMKGGKKERKKERKRGQENGKERRKERFRVQQQHCITTHIESRRRRHCRPARLYHYQTLAKHITTSRRATASGRTDGRTSPATTIALREARRDVFLYSLGVPVNFRRDDVTGTIPGAPQQDTAELDLRAVPAVSLAQVEHINPAVVGERHDGLRGLLAAAAAHAESGPCPCAHKTNQATHQRAFPAARTESRSNRDNNDASAG